MIRLELSMNSETTSQRSALEALESWDGLPRLDAILDEIGGRENFFQVVPVDKRKEKVHSDIIAWWLDPKRWHGGARCCPRRAASDLTQSPDDDRLPGCTAQPINARGRASSASGMSRASSCGA